MIKMSKGLFLNIFFWCAPFGYLYFQFFFSVIDSKLLTSIKYTVPRFEPMHLGHEPSALTTRPVVLKPGVATHLCVAKILQCVAKIEHYLKLSKKVNHSYHTKDFCLRIFSHRPYIINLSLHKTY